MTKISFSIFLLIIGTGILSFIKQECLIYIHLLGDCEGLDKYYLVTVDLMELYSITDHDDLLYIDVRGNEIKKLTTSE